MQPDPVNCLISESQTGYLGHYKYDIRHTAFLLSDEESMGSYVWIPPDPAVLPSLPELRAT